MQSCLPLGLLHVHLVGRQSGFVSVSRPARDKDNRAKTHLGGAAEMAQWEKSVPKAQWPEFDPWNHRVEEEKCLKKVIP